MELPVQPHPAYPEIKVPLLQQRALLTLFSEGLDLDQVRLRALFERPPAALISDALALLAHAAEAAPHYQARDAQAPLSVAELSFPAHALWLLAQLRATAHWPEVAAFLQADARLGDFWLGIGLPKGLWQVVYQLGRKRLPALADMVRSTTSAQQRREIVLAVGQIGWHSPLRRGEVSAWIAALLRDIAALPEAHAPDRALAALLIVEVSQLRFSALLPQIAALYAQERVDASIAGQYADVVREVEGLVNSHARADLQSIFAFYAHARRTWQVYRDAPEAGETADTSAILDLRGTPLKPGKGAPAMRSFDPRKKPQRKSAKTGRNAPCPCGSGKKYKRCHGK